MTPKESTITEINWSAARLPFMDSRQPMGRMPTSVEGKMAMPADWPKMQLRIQSMKQSAPSLAADTNLA